MGACDHLVVNLKKDPNGDLVDICKKFDITFTFQTLPFSRVTYICPTQLCYATSQLHTALYHLLTFPLVFVQMFVDDLCIGLLFLVSG